jgi:hypothetical protein
MENEKWKMESAWMHAWMVMYVLYLDMQTGREGLYQHPRLGIFHLSIYLGIHTYIPTYLHKVHTYFHTLHTYIHPLAYLDLETEADKYLR